jgi:GTPase SAR1 family protein
MKVACPTAGTVKLPYAKTRLQSSSLRRCQESLTIVLVPNLTQTRRHFARGKTDRSNLKCEPLGKDHGRVVLNAAKPHLAQRLAAFREELKAHQDKVEKELQSQLDDSRKQIVDYFVPRVVASPPDAMRGQFLKCEEVDARAWLDSELDRVFPKAETLIQKMQLEVRYKDVTSS